MAITLEKGQRIGIGLSKVSVGLGWDPNEGTGFDFDLDASAFMLGSNKKIPNDNYSYSTIIRNLQTERWNLQVMTLLEAIVTEGMMKH